MHTGAGTQVHHMIRGKDRIGVVLHDDHGIAGIAQCRQRAEQACVVTLVQADGGLIEDVHDARESGAHLACQADALRSPPESDSALRSSVR